MSSPYRVDASQAHGRKQADVDSRSAQGGRMFNTSRRNGRRRNSTSTKEAKMKSKAYRIILVGLASVLLAAQASSAEEQVNPAAQQSASDAIAEENATFNLDMQKNHADVGGLPADKKSVQNFLHKKHAAEYIVGNSEYSAFKFEDSFTCKACHHKAGKPEEVKSCFNCKDLGVMADSVGGFEKIKEIFHKTCKACHKSMADAGKTTGPTSCKGCHG